jgi:osmotically-inducible protein OsmY
MRRPGAGYAGGVDPEPAEYVVERLHRALAEDPSVHELGVQVTVAGARVFLTGHVPTVERREAISALARQVLPDYELHNQTTVGNFPEAQEQEDVR